MSGTTERISIHVINNSYLSSAIVAKNLAQDSFGLIFGVNGWLGSILLFVYNLVIVSDNIFSFNLRELYTIFGCYFYVLVLFFTGYGIFKTVQEGRIKLV